LGYGLGEETDDRSNNKGHAPDETLDYQNHGDQDPIKKLIHIGHALGYPIEDGLEDMQRLEVSINNEKDQGTSRDRELQPGTKFYPQKLIQQQLCTDIEDDQVSRWLENGLPDNLNDPQPFEDREHDGRSQD